MKVSPVATARSLILKASDLCSSQDNPKFWNPEIVGPVTTPKHQLHASMEYKPPKLSENDIEVAQKEETDSCYLRELQEQLETLHSNNENARALNQSLVKQLNKANNQIRILKALEEETIGTRQKIYSDLQKAHETVSAMQRQKIAIINKQGELNHNHEVSKVRIEILEEQVQSLSKRVTFLEEETAFLKQINSDFQKQAIMLKQQLKGYLSVVKQCEKMEEAVNSTNLMNQEINNKFANMQLELRDSHYKISQQQKDEEKYIQEQNKLFLKIQELQNANIVLQEQKTSAQELFRSKDEELRNVLKNKDQYQRRYLKIATEMQAKIQALLFQVMALDKRNRELVDERDHYKWDKGQEGLKIGSQQFLTILKQDNNHINNLKEKLDRKEGELERLKDKYEEQEANWRQKNEELVALLKIREISERNASQHFEMELQTLRRQCSYLMKKNQEMKSKQLRLKLEVSEKDRIICKHVERKRSPSLTVTA